MEDREVGQEWFMLTCLSLMLSALKGCHKGLSMDYLTVAGFLEQVVHLHYLILPSTTTRFVEEWLDINKICPEHFVMTLTLILINFTLLDWLLCMVGPVSTSGHILLVMTIILMIYIPVHVTVEAQIRSLHFVGNDYYCESGNNGPSGGCTSRLYSEDVLWDGKQCGDIESSCCTHPNMPWFIKTLSEATSDDIELRACGSDSCWGTAPIFLIELYIR